MVFVLSQQLNWHKQRGAVDISSCRSCPCVRVCVHVRVSVYVPGRCDEKTCENGGHCSGAQCACPPGYQGPRCQQGSSSITSAVYTISLARAVLPSAQPELLTAVVAEQEVNCVWGEDTLLNGCGEGCVRFCQN